LRTYTESHEFPAGHPGGMCFATIEIDMIKFEELGLSTPVMSAISEMGYVEPSPVQEKAIPFLMAEDRDFVALAQTGTGKTAAFGLPAIEKTDVKNRKAQTLILSPTRELCLQIVVELNKFCKNIPGIKVVAVYGGAPIYDQIRKLNDGAHFIVATPGRMVDLIERKKVDLSHIKRVVLDEADEMLNMGFRDDLDSILKDTPETKNTWLFSATMPREAENIANRYMNDPHTITMGKKNAGTDNVNHLYYRVQARDRYLALKRVMDINPDIYGIIFCRTRQETKDVAEKLIKDGYNADALHGDLSQAQRDLVMRRFRLKTLQMLVATDVAARGIDVNDLTHVINYNLPDDVENYTHRSGRTGRAGKKGVSISIIHSRETSKIRQIEHIIKQKFDNAKVPNGEEVCEAQLFSLINKVNKAEVQEEKIAPYMEKVMETIGELPKEDLVKRFVAAEFNRFLEYYKDAPDLNIPDKREYDRDGGRRGRDGDRRDRDRGRGRSRSNDSNYTRFFINQGVKDGMTKRDLMGMINRVTRRRDITLGRIDVMKNFSFFEADKGMESDILKSFKNAVNENERPVVVEVAGDRKDDKRKGNNDSRRKGPFTGGRSGERKDYKDRRSGNSGGRREFRRKY